MDVLLRRAIKVGIGNSLGAKRGKYKRFAYIRRRVEWPDSVIGELKDMTIKFGPTKMFPSSERRVIYKPDIVSSENIFCKVTFNEPHCCSRESFAEDKKLRNILEKYDDSVELKIANSSHYFLKVDLIKPGTDAYKKFNNLKEEFLEEM